MELICQVTLSSNLGLGIRIRAVYAGLPQSLVLKKGRRIYSLNSTIMGLLSHIYERKVLCQIRMTEDISQNKKKTTIKIIIQETPRPN
jgi:hypothetical protein